MAPFFQKRFYLIAFSTLSVLLIIFCMSSLALLAAKQAYTTDAHNARGNRTGTNKRQPQQAFSRIPTIQLFTESGLQAAQYAPSLAEQTAGQSVNTVLLQVAEQHQALAYQGNQWYQWSWGKNGKSSGTTHQHTAHTASSSDTTQTNLAATDKQGDSTVDQNSYFNLFANPLYPNQLSNWSARGNKLPVLPGFGQ